ncbi:MAG: hypothetical protein RL711_1070 [Bacteroidota bacterium]|jgi:hypothetical protein
MKTSLFKMPIIVALGLLFTCSSIHAQNFGGINLGSLGNLNNIVNINLDSINAVKNQFIDFKYLTNTLSASLSNTLADSTFITKKQLDGIQSQLSSITNNQDSILKLIADSTKISVDSLNTLKNNFTTLQGKQDSLIGLVIAQTGLGSNQFIQLSQNLQSFQNNQDSIIKLIADSTQISADSLLVLKNNLNQLSLKQDSITKIITTSTGLNLDSLYALQTNLLALQQQTDSLSTAFLTTVSNINNLNQKTIDDAKSQLNLLQQELSGAINNVNTSVDNNSLVLVSFSVFPNPCKNYFQINSPFNLLSVQLFNLSGQQIASFAPQNQYDLSSNAAGVYIIHVALEHTTIIQKLIIE